MFQLASIRQSHAMEQIARHPQQQVLPADPHVALRVLRERPGIIAREVRIVRPVEDNKARPVEPGQTLLGQNPQRTIARLEYVPHIIVRQPVLLAETETPVFIGHRKRRGRGKTCCWISAADPAEQNHRRKNDAG